MADEIRGRFAYDLDRLLHEKARLGIMTSLLAYPHGLVFNELKRLVDLTDGNLSRHLHVLNEAGLVELQKGFEGRRPQTTCLLTDEGRTRFLEYLDELEKVVRDAVQRARSERSTGETGWAPA